MLIHDEWGVLCRRDWCWRGPQRKTPIAAVRAWNRVMDAARDEEQRSRNYRNLLAETDRKDRTIAALKGALTKARRKT